MRIFYLIFLPLFILALIITTTFYFVYLNEFEENYLLNCASKSLFFPKAIERGVIGTALFTNSDADTLLLGFKRGEKLDFAIYNQSGWQVYPRGATRNQIKLANYSPFLDKNISFYYLFEDYKLKIVYPIYISNRIAGYWENYEDISEFRSQKKEVFFYFLGTGTLFLILVFIFSLLISSYFKKSIKEVAIAIDDAGKAPFDYQFKILGIKDLEIIEQSFNRVLLELKRYYQTSQINKQKMEGIINSIREGFLVLDNSGKVLVYNQGFESMIMQTGLNGKYYWEIMPNADFDALVKKVQKKRKNVVSEIEINNRYYVWSGNYLEEEREIAIIMNDITPLKMLESIKKEFVVNVSHELRTPLTAIKGFVETMRGDAPEEIQRYLSIIERHTNRLINIVDDLLTLSELENKSRELLREPVDIKGLLENVRVIFEQRIKDKGLKLNINVEEGFPKVNLDVFRIEQMFINLLDNAIKYTDEGEICVEVSYEEHFAKIVVRDTGIGIPSDKIDRIFERFYVVDKSRSRKVGGTGLGLAIVKHIVLLHNGEIKVKNVKPNGTEFTILIPIE